MITSILEAFARSAAVGDFYVAPSQSVALKERKAWFSYALANHHMTRHNASRVLHDALFRPQLAR